MDKKLNGLEFFDAGAKNNLTIDGIMGVIQPDSAPNRRIRDAAKKEGRYFDFTEDKKTRSLILKLTEHGLFVIASSRYAQSIISDISKIKNDRDPKLVLTTIGEDGQPKEEMGS